MPQRYAFKAMEEVSMLGQLQSPHIVKYIDSFLTGKKVAIVMEYCPNGDLEKFLIKQSELKKPLTED